MHQQTYRASSLPCGRIPVCVQSPSVRPANNSSTVSRIFHALPKSARKQGTRTPASTHQGSATVSKVDIDSPFTLKGSSIEAYRRNGFVKIPKVFDKPTLAHFGPAMSLEVAEADKTPLQKDPDYQQAFTQVQNLWRKNQKVLEFIKGQRLGRIAAELMGVEGVRFYADQALYKEPHGGYTPWHCDAFYWPLATDKAVTAWIPLQPGIFSTAQHIKAEARTSAMATVDVVVDKQLGDETPLEMGPMQFAAGSQEHDLGRHLEIGRESHKLIDAKVQKQGLEIVSEPFEFGEVSFHSSLNFHKADGNQTDRARQVFTIIFMDKDMQLAEPMNEYQHRDRDAYFPELLPGQVCDTARSPIVWARSM